MLPTTQHASRFQLGIFILVGVLLFILPILVIPGTPLFFTKTFAISFVAILGLLLFIAGELKSRRIQVPTSPVLLALWLIPIAYLLSATFSSNIQASLFGQSLGVDTFFYILFAVIITTLTAVLLSNRKYTVFLYATLITSGVLLAIFHIARLVMGPETLSFGIFTTAATTPVGGWNDLAVFFGLFIILGLITSLSTAVKGSMKWIINGMLVVGLFFVALTNFSVVWWVVGLAALSIFVYSVIAGSSRTLPAHGDQMSNTTDQPVGEQNTTSISFLSLGVIAVSLVFIVFGTSVGGYLSNVFEVSPFTVRPSWESTIDIGKNTYAESPLFGSGANTFSKQWLLNKPNEVNKTIFWNTRFASGIGFIPTSLVTTGLVGFIAWVLFIGLFSLSGLRIFTGRREGSDTLTQYLVSSTFILAMYLWVMAVLYTPSVVVLLLAFIFTGLFVGSLRYLQEKPSALLISFADNPRLGFIAVLVLTVVFLGSIGTLFKVGEKYLAAVHITQAQERVAQGDIEGALARVSTAVQLDHNDAHYRAASEIARQQLTGLLAQEGQPTEAQRAQFQRLVSSVVQNAQAAVQIDDTNDMNWRTLAQAYQILVPVQIEGTYDNAVRAYDQALMYNPHSPALLLDRARLELLVNDRDVAKEYIQKALAEKSNYTEARFLLAQIQLAEGNVNEAITSVESIALLNPNDPVVFFQLGILYYGVGNYSTAIQVLERAVTLDQQYSNARYFLGLSYYRTNRIQDAIDQFTVIRQLNPGNEEIISILSNLENGRSPLPSVAPISELDGPPLGEE